MARRLPEIDGLTGASALFFNWSLVWRAKFA